MNAILEKNIIEHLHRLDDANLYKVLHFIESIHSQNTELPKITGLFAHLNVDETKLADELDQAELNRKTSLEKTLDIL